MHMQEIEHLRRRCRSFEDQVYGVSTWLLDRSVRYLVKYRSHCVISKGIGQIVCSFIANLIVLEIQHSHCLYVMILMNVKGGVVFTVLFCNKLTADCNF
jgi:hypothetical protein